MPFTDFLRSWLLVHLFSYLGQSYPMNTSMFLALYDGNGIELSSEPGYARVEVFSGAWSPAAAGSMINAVSISFPEATADWTENVVGWGLYDASNNLLITGIFSKEYTVYTHDILMFDIGALQITLDGIVPAGILSDYAENVLLDHIFGKTQYNAPANISIGLLTADPGDAITNTNANEVPANPTTGYARAVTSPSDWEVGASNDIWNQNVIEFISALSDWGTITHCGLFDVHSAGVQGNALAAIQLVTPRLVVADSTPKFAITGPTTLGIDIGVDLP